MFRSHHALDFRKWLLQGGGVNDKTARCIADEFERLIACDRTPFLRNCTLYQSSRETVIFCHVGAVDCIPYQPTQPRPSIDEIFEGEDVGRRPPPFKPRSQNWGNQS